MLKIYIIETLLLCKWIVNDTEERIVYISLQTYYSPSTACGLNWHIFLTLFKLTHCWSCLQSRNKYSLKVPVNIVYRFC